MWATESQSICAFNLWPQIKNLKPDCLTLSKLFIPLIWEEKSLSDFCNYPECNGRNGAETSYFRSVLWSFGEALWGLCGKAPSESVEMQSPITAAAGVMPWQQAPNQPENWLKNDQLPEKRPGRKDSEKYGFYLIQLNCKRNSCKADAPCFCTLQPLTYFAKIQQ